MYPRQRSYPPVTKDGRASVTMRSSGSESDTESKDGKNGDYLAYDASGAIEGSSAKKTILMMVLLGITVFAIGFGIGLGIQKGYAKSQNTSIVQDEDIPATSTTNATTLEVTSLPTEGPTSFPTVADPTSTPTDGATQGPSLSPSHPPTQNPTNLPTESEVVATYRPGNLTKLEANLLLSEGLTARLIATSGQPVEYHNGTLSERSFHFRPDGGATFLDTRDWNVGGWVYVSNSEIEAQGEGGVGAITFDKDGNVIDYRMVLENTTMNCAGGRTPWNTWVSCEEVEFFGKAYQVDPFGERTAEMTTIGSAGGRWEAFAYDIRNPDQPRFFLTEDHNKGTTRRFTPNTTYWGGDEWKMLHEDGVIDYLYVRMNANKTGGTFEWVTDIEAARNNARTYFPQSEGVDVNGSKLYLVCKGIKQLFIFDLDDMTYENMTTTSGLFDGSPDQMKRVLGDTGGLLYFTEEGGVDAGVHARDEFGRFFTILESPAYLDETTGLAFSPNGMHMYIAYQGNGTLFDVWREDGLPFNAQSLNVKYHNLGTRRLSTQWVGF